MSRNQRAVVSSQCLSVIKIMHLKIGCLSVVLSIWLRQPVRSVRKRRALFKIMLWNAYCCGIWENTLSFIFFLVYFLFSLTHVKICISPKHCHVFFWPISRKSDSVIANSIFELIFKCLLTHKITSPRYEFGYFNLGVTRRVWCLLILSLRVESFSTIICSLLGFGESEVPVAVQAVYYHYRISALFSVLLVYVSVICLGEVLAHVCTDRDR